MSSTDKWRAFLLVINLALIALIVALGYKTFGTRSSVPSSEKTQAIDPKDFEIKTRIVEDRPLSSFRAVWTNLRPAPPPKPVVRKQIDTPKTPITPTVRLKQDFELINAAIYNSDPKRSSCMLQKRSGNKILVRVGEKIPQTELTLVELRRVTANTVKAWVKSKSGKKESIEMKEVSKR